jgi:hypothetical protein
VNLISATTTQTGLKVILLKKLVTFLVQFIEIIANISFMTYTAITIKKLHQRVEDKSIKSITEA